MGCRSRWRSALPCQCSQQTRRGLGQARRVCFLLPGDPCFIGPVLPEQAACLVLHCITPQTIPMRQTAGYAGGAEQYSIYIIMYLLDLLRIFYGALAKVTRLLSESCPFGDIPTKKETASACREK